MKRKTLLLIMLTILATVVVYFVTSEKGTRLVDPTFVQPTPVSTPSPPQTPKTFQFDSSTDLKVELEKVNPQVLDSDFE